MKREPSEGLRSETDTKEQADHRHSSLCFLTAKTMTSAALHSCRNELNPRCEQEQTLPSLLCFLSGVCHSAEKRINMVA